MGALHRACARGQGRECVGGRKRPCRGGDEDVAWQRGRLCRGLDRSRLVPAHARRDRRRAHRGNSRRRLHRHHDGGEDDHHRQ